MTNHGLINNKLQELLFKNTTNNIPRGPNVIESAMTRFEKKIKTAFNNKTQLKRINITKLQENTLH